MEKKLEYLNDKIYGLYNLISFLEGLNELFEQRKEVYLQYEQLFDLHGETSWNCLISGVACLVDKKNFSLVKILIDLEEKEKNIELKNKIIELKKQITTHKTYKSIQCARNNFGIAHLEEKISLDEVHRKKLYQENKVSLIEVKLYLELCEQVLQKVAKQYKIQIWKVMTKHIKTQMMDMFKKL